MQSRRVPSFRNRKGGITIRGNKARKQRRAVDRSTTSTMVNRASLRDHTIIADRFLTKVSASYTGAIAPGVANGYFDIYGNSMFQPFNSSHTISTGGVTGTGGSVVTIEPMGFNALSSLYNEYRVRGSRVKLTMTPSNASDATTFIVYPTPAVNAAVIAPNLAMNNRYSKWKMCTSANNVKENTIIHYMNSASALGLTKQQYDTTTTTAIGAPPSAPTAWYWQVSWYPNSGVNTVGAIYVTVEIDYYVELSYPVALPN